MSFMHNKSVDKVNMSLDDIIKLNRNQSRQNKFSSNRNINSNNKNGIKNNFQRQNNNNKNQNQRGRQQQLLQQQRKQVNNKPYGILNRSRVIQKRTQNVRILQAQQNNNQQQQRQMARINANQASRIPRNSRRRPMNAAPQKQRLFNRLSMRGVGSNIRNKFQNGNNNQIVKNNGQDNNQRIKAQKFLSRSQPTAKLQDMTQQKVRKPLRQPRAGNNNPRTKIAMQSARKNVIKAKRLLVNKITKKGPIQQIMTQRYAKSLGLVQSTGPKIKRINMKNNRPQGRKFAQRPSKMLTVNINNRVNKVNKLRLQQRQKLKKTAQIASQQFKKTNINKNRMQQKSNAGRKVFF